MSLYAQGAMNTYYEDLFASVNPTYWSGSGSVAAGELTPISNLTWNGPALNIGANDTLVIYAKSRAVYPGSWASSLTSSIEIALTLSNGHTILYRIRTTLANRFNHRIGAEINFGTSYIEDLVDDAAGETILNTLRIELTREAVTFFLDNRKLAAYDFTSSVTSVSSLTFFVGGANNTLLQFFADTFFVGGIAGLPSTGRNFGITEIPDRHAFLPSSSGQIMYAAGYRAIPPLMNRRAFHNAMRTKQK